MRQLNQYPPILTTFRFSLNTNLSPCLTPHHCGTVANSLGGGFYIMINTIITVAAFMTVISLLTIILVLAIYAVIKAIGDDIDKNEY